MSQKFDLGNLPDPEAVFQSWWPIIIGVTCGVLYAVRQYMRGARCMNEKKLEGKVVIITGASGGIGRFTANDLAKRGARVYLACRTAEQAKETETDVRTTSKNQNVFGLQCNLESFKSVRDFVTDFKKKEDKVHFLILNAGVMMCPFVLTKDNFETQFQVNYLGHFLLTHLLFETVRTTEGSRIISVIAPAYQLGEIDFDEIKENSDYQPSRAYAQSKLALFMFSQTLSQKLKDDNVPVNCANPGVTNTEIYRHLAFKKSSFLSMSFSPFIWFLMKTVEDGAQTVLYCSVGEKAEQLTGMLFKECEEVPTAVGAMDVDLQLKLFQESMKWVGIKKFGEVDVEEEITED